LLDGISDFFIAKARLKKNVAPTNNPIAL